MANINALSARQTLEKRYSGARLNILLVAAFTLLNIIFLAAESGTFFLFSAYIPYLLVDMGMLFCGLKTGRHLAMPAGFWSLWPDSNRRPAHYE